MEKLSKKENKENVELSEDSEHIIIGVGDKKRFIPKQEKINVNCRWVNTEVLVTAMTIFYEDDPAEALEKYEKMKEGK